MSVRTSAIVSVRLERRLRATELGTYPISAMACSTRARTLLLTGPESFTTRETVMAATPARFATSTIVGIDSAPSAATAGGLERRVVTLAWKRYHGALGFVQRVAFWCQSRVPMSIRTRHASPPQEECPMLKTRLLHPEILQALGEAGHGAQVLIADGNYPLATRSSGAARHVHLNLAPGLVTVTDVLRVLVVMIPDSGPEPGIFAEFRDLLPEVPLQPLGRFQFYDTARGPDLALAISTGEQRIYANLLLTIGVLMPE